MVINANVSQECCIETSEGKRHVSVAAYEDVCKHRMLANECISKISDTFGNYEAGR